MCTAFRRGAMALGLVLSLGVGAARSARAAEDPPSAREVQARMSQRLDGRHFSALVELEVERAGMTETRRLRVWRDDEDGHRERLMARFELPADMRGLGLLYVENETRINDYFIYQPSVGRVRRVPETLVRQDVYGVDLEYLGFGVAQIEPTRAEDLERVTHRGRPAWQLTERALRDNPRFDHRRMWIDASSFVPLRVEHIRQDRVVLVAETLRTERVHGVETPFEVFFERPLDDERVSMRIQEIDYDAPIPQAFFSTLKLIKER